MSNKVNPQSLGLNLTTAEHAAEEMNKYLANLQVLYIKLHNLHWNVTGSQFFEMHEKTQELYEHVGEEIDVIAERLKMIGFYPVGSLSEALNLATITEITLKEEFSSSKVASIVIEDLQILIRHLREINNNFDISYTGGLTEEAVNYYEKQNWLFSAYLGNN